ncbi:Outer membrane protein assembly factor BamB [subsurface metagenome]
MFVMTIPVPLMDIYFVTHKYYVCGSNFFILPQHLTAFFIQTINTLASFTNHVAVVYWGDEGRATVTGEWEGSFTAKSQEIEQDLKENYILYFAVLEDSEYEKQNIYFLKNIFNQKGEEKFTVRSGGGSKSISYQIDSGNTWSADISPRGPVLIEDGFVYVGGEYGLFCIKEETGSLMWRNEEIRGNEIVLSGDRIFSNHWVDISSSKPYPEGIFCVDKKSGRILWHSNEINTTKIELSGDRIYIHHLAGGIYCLDKEGTVLWKNTDIRADDFTVGENRVIVGHYNDIYCLDATSGEVLWHNSVYKNKQPVIEILNGKVYFLTSEEHMYSSIMKTSEGVYCYSLYNGKKLWYNNVPKGDRLILDGKRIYVLGGNRVHCLAAEKGGTLWINEGMHGRYFVLSDGKIYAQLWHSYGDYPYGRWSPWLEKRSLGCFSAETGNLLWIINKNINDGSIFKLSNPYGNAGRDLFPKTIADGKLYLMNREWVFNLDLGNFKTLGMKNRDYKPF